MADNYDYTNYSSSHFLERRKHCKVQYDIYAKNPFEMDGVKMMATGLNELSNLRVAIVGLGLMGGSLAMTLRQHVAHLTVVDNDLATVEKAARMELASTITEDLASGVSGADLVILATPVSVIIGTIAQLPELCPEGCFLIDFGSTKREICAMMDRLPINFEAIGGHPMCGREQSGFQAASADLYQDQTFILCPNGRTTKRVEEVAIQIIRCIGATPLFLAPGRHDALVSGTSHLPYIVSSILMSRVYEQAAADSTYWQVSATGLRDTTRLAGSNARMMLDIIFSNRDEIIRQLQGFSGELDILMERLLSNDEEAIFAWLDTVQKQQMIFRDARWSTREADRLMQSDASMGK